MSNDDTIDTNDNSRTTSLPGGGGVRIQFGGQTLLDAPVPPPEGMEVAAVRTGETLRVNTATGELESLGGVTKFSTSELVDVNADDIMATVRSPVTMGPATNPNEKSIVRAMGQDMPISTALALGWLVRTANGFQETAKYRAERGARDAGKV